MQCGFRLLAAVALVVALGYAGLTATRFARAEWLSRADTIEALEQASRITPGNASYYARIAALDPARHNDLQTALTLNPRDPSSWILKSVRDEEDGDVAVAERNLLRANEVAQYYTPRWSLAAFYFRQQNRTKFADAARAALSVGYGDADSLFRMAQRLGFSSSEILTTILPGDPIKLESYVRLVLGDADLSALDAATTKLLAIGSAPQASIALDACDLLFSAGRTDRSVQIWNKLVEAGWIHHRRLDPAGGLSLANSRFDGEALGRGFDWRYTNTSGVSRSLDTTGLRLDFSGKLPERCDLLSQRIVAGAHRRYRLTVRYRVDGIPGGAGLTISVRPLTGAAPMVDGILTSESSNWRDESFEFQAPSQAIPLELALHYARSVGTTRIEGRLWIASIELEPIS